LTPSHYAVGFKLLGIDLNPLFGSAKPIRSDEWAALTPMFQIAVRGDFSTIDVISPYHESLRSFWALPIEDWSLAFKPQLWAFWVLPPSFAYSFYFAFLFSAFLSGYTIALRLLGCSLGIASLTAVSLYFSHFVQVWWTSNAPTFAFAPWPLIVFLLPLRPLTKGPLLFLASSIWIFSCVYPPFIISVAFAFGVLIVAQRPDTLKVENVAVAVLAAAATAVGFYGYFGDLIAVMAHTSYPGRRQVSGGDVPWRQLASHLFPFMNTLNFRSLLRNSNECEVAVVATMLPLSLLAFAQWGSLRDFSTRHWRSLCVIGGGLVLMAMWMFVPIPSYAGQLLLWNYVPPSRMLWGFGVLMTACIAFAASHVAFTITLKRALVLSLAVLTVSFTAKVLLHPTQDGFSFPRLLAKSWFDGAAVIPFFAIALLPSARMLSDATTRLRIFSAATLSVVATFGTFNPWQVAHPIFNLPDSSLLQSFRLQAKHNPNGWAVIPGFYGSLLNGAGISAINHTLMAPQISFFRAAFPDLSEAELQATFNRYGHVVPKVGGVLGNPQPDVIVVPAERFHERVR
jgi:hypothetical protein